MMHSQIHHLCTITVLPTGGKLHFSFWNKLLHRMVTGRIKPCNSVVVGGGGRFEA